MKDLGIYRKNGQPTTVFCLVGPTAVGKTALALELAEHYEAEIISVDSMQVYRYLDIGTAKATPEERRRVPHHLIDIIDPDEDYSLARFLADAAAALADIGRRGRAALFTGGTGLYLRGLRAGIFDLGPPDEHLRAELARRLTEEGASALYAELQRVDPASASRIHPNDRQRLLRALEIFYHSGTPWSEHLRRGKQNALLPDRVPVIGLACERDILYERINRRVDSMLAVGLIDEVQGLLARGYGPELPPMQAIGYRHMVQYLNGSWTLEQARELLARDTRRYAKRQLTWLRQTSGIIWCDQQDHTSIKRVIDKNS
ncbi:tRNA (adenosine(37)-N6)-dimethylallyltransferase MiaA [Desulfurivibrio dismutans]|uniref:tRNA (adenosine(37)-N6)-dimethylallyltransferase MiaA n=1 Tax=Desulfurivibrio dismutans TaxID=1398908 RepID=UPI0023DCDA3D|nr:tRNA (adenosine(37)-N6)-dimethylallyltransferase MiaA [Desulfurivibrio alkaliphilus]MDF1615017.1 tRNA (adenosine(37)-N6)-dimethylallyltransferase MiaA [Desulfurivibrio alkaliphilus]